MAEVTVLHRELRVAIDRGLSPDNLRVVALHDDDATFSVGVMDGLGDTMQVEVSSRIDAVERLSRAILSGEPRAKTAPGLARILAGAVVLLVKACHEAGALDVREAEDA